MEKEVSSLRKLKRSPVSSTESLDMLRGVFPLQPRGRRLAVKLHYTPSTLVARETPRFFSASSLFRDPARSTPLPLPQKVRLELPETLLRRRMVI